MTYRILLQKLTKLGLIVIHLYMYNWMILAKIGEKGKQDGKSV